MGRGLTGTAPADGIFLMNGLPVVARFMQTPEFAPLYYRWLRDLASGPFSPAQMNPVLDQLKASSTAARGSIPPSRT